MGDVGRGCVTCRPEDEDRTDPALTDAIDAYLRLTHGDVRQALALSVADAIAVSRLVSTGFARLRQPEKRRRS